VNKFGVRAEQNRLIDEKPGEWVRYNEAMNDGEMESTKQAETEERKKERKKERKRKKINS